MRKAKKYKDDYAAVLDIERSTAVFPCFCGILHFLKWVDSISSETKIKCEVQLVHFEDRFSHPLPSGYRDLQFFFLTASGFVGEMQLNTNQLYEKKGELHRTYDVTRVLHDKITHA